MCELWGHISHPSSLSSGKRVFLYDFTDLLTLLFKAFTDTRMKMNSSWLLFSFEHMHGNMKSFKHKKCFWAQVFFFYHLLFIISNRSFLLMSLKWSNVRGRIVHHEISYIQVNVNLKTKTSLNLALRKQPQRIVTFIHWEQNLQSHSNSHFLILLYRFFKVNLWE